MDIQARYTFSAKQSLVWDLLMDTDAIEQCMPGCRGLRPRGTDCYDAELIFKVAAISGSFNATIALEDKHPPHSYTLAVTAAGHPGFINGRALVTLTEENGRTLVQISTSADVGGMIARVGQRLIEGVARMTMDRFYECLAKRLEPAAG
jgi:uncharacterized protein